MSNYGPKLSTRLARDTDKAREILVALRTRFCKLAQQDLNPADKDAVISLAHDAQLMVNALDLAPWAAPLRGLPEEAPATE